MNPLVSIIVPIYNVEDYLGQCLDSLLNQSYSNIELILVNDGSTDHSLELIEDYQKRYPHQFTLYTKINGGLSDARNYGLERSKGEYIAFIDSDDYVETDYIEKMMDETLKSHSKLTVCDIDVFYESGKRYVMNGLRSLKDVNPINALFLSPLFAWNKLYHRSLFMDTQLRYPLGLWYEDIPVTIPVFAQLDHVGVVNEALIHYRQRNTSIMGSKNSPKLQDIFTILSMITQNAKQNHYFSTYRDEIEYLHIEHLLLYGSFRFYRSEKSKEYMKKAFELMDDHFPQWKKNPYLKTLKPLYHVYLKLLNRLTMPIFQRLIVWKGKL